MTYQNQPSNNVPTGASSPVGFVRSPIVKPEDFTMDDLKHLSKESFPLWCLTSGAQMDGHFIDFNKHRYLLPIYACMEDEIVWRKAAQLGATTFMLLRQIWWLHYNQGRKAALYFPTKEGVENLSKDRLGPLIDSIEDINMEVDNQDKLGLRKIGKSSFYLFHLGGVASKDSVPLDFLAFDEVRLCNPKDIDQCMERIAHSEYKIKIYMSTCGLPDDTIDDRFQGGTQHIWHSKCGCPDGCDLARSFPDCVVDDKKRNKLYLRCPKCKFVIRDPQNGRYVPHNPGADYPSFAVSQLSSSYNDLCEKRFISLKDIWNFYHRTTNKAEFFNAKLGLPWVDEQNRGITKDQMDACVDPMLEWAKPKKTKHTAMGVDQGGGYLYVVIADLHGNKKRIRHVELIESANPDYMEAGKIITPFKRLAQLMEEYDVKVACVDAMPNYNEALSFAQQFPGRVFCSFYNNGSKDVVNWGDKPKVKITLKKAGPFLKFKYIAILSTFLSMSVALGEFAQGNVIMPDPDRLIQMAFHEKTRDLQPEAIPRRLQSMLMRLVKRFHVTNEETGEGRHEWIYAGGDPHFAHAWNYTNVALERLKRQVIFTWG